MEPKQQYKLAYRAERLRLETMHQRNRIMTSSMELVLHRWWEYSLWFNNWQATLEKLNASDPSDEILGAAYDSLYMTLF